MSATHKRVFVTADTHFGHDNIIKSCNRPFSSVEEMDEKMIANWNNVITDNDVVWHLGDFAICKNHDYIWLTFKRLNGIKRLILGNHDISTRGEYVQEFDWDMIEHVTYLANHGLQVVACHYAMRSWRGSGHGAIMLHGHSHGKLPPMHNSLDVGVDLHNFTPLLIEEACEMAKAITTEAQNENNNDPHASNADS